MDGSEFAAASRSQPLPTDTRPRAAKSSAGGSKRNRSRLVGFHFHAPSAQSVELAGDFTDWEKAPVRMTRRSDGVWLTALPLGPGDYAYRFIVDQQWCDDPSCTQRVANPFGTTNAVVSVI